MLFQGNEVEGSYPVPGDGEDFPRWIRDANSVVGGASRSWRCSKPWPMLRIQSSNVECHVVLIDLLAVRGHVSVVRTEGEVWWCGDEGLGELWRRGVASMVLHVLLEREGHVGCEGHSRV